MRPFSRDKNSSTRLSLSFRTVRVCSSSSCLKHESCFAEIRLDSTSRNNLLTFFDYIINPSLSSSLQKELKAARQLGLLVGVFTVCWLPYFILFLVVAWCEDCVSQTIFSTSIWLGYLNSTLNPLIYPLCNVHFRQAFKKMILCQHSQSKAPNFTHLRELRPIHSFN